MLTHRIYICFNMRVAKENIHQPYKFKKLVTKKEKIVCSHQRY